MRVLAIISGLILGGCVSQREPAFRLPHANPVTQAEHCANGVALLNHPGMTSAQTTVLIETMRNRGCMGPAQPQTLQLR